MIQVILVFEQKGKQRRIEKRRKGKKRKTNKKQNKKSKKKLVNPIKISFKERLRYRDWYM